MGESIFHIKLYTVSSGREGKNTNKMSEREETAVTAEVDYDFSSLKKFPHVASQNAENFLLNTLLCFTFCLLSQVSASFSPIFHVNLSKLVILNYIFF